MNLVRWRQRSGNGDLSPIDSMAAFHDEMDNVFSRFLAPMDFGRSLTSGLTFGPRIDLVDGEKSMTVSVELPGVNPDDIELTVTGDTLSIKGEKKTSRNEKDGGVQYFERQYGCFQRSLQLPAAVNAEGIEAKFKDGVLTVDLPKHPNAVAKRIEVKAG